MKTLFSLLLGLSVLQAQVKEVKIGTQVWMAENLNVATFRNGEPIPEAKTDEEWNKALVNHQPAWCYYNNDPVNGKKYGKLYNWYAVNDPRGLAPRGWHIPTSDEWTTLSDFLGGDDNAGTKMKSKTGWKVGCNGTNSSGFNGLPGGWRYNDGIFSDIGTHGFWWSSTESEFDREYHAQDLVYDLHLNDCSGKAYGRSRDKHDYLSVRCLRD